MNQETRKILSQSINIDKLPMEYFTMNGTTISIYRGALLQVGEREYITYVKNDVPKIGWVLQEQMAPGRSGVLEPLVMFREQCPGVSQKNSLSQDLYVLFIDYNNKVYTYLSKAVPYIHADQVWEMA
jgi:hypothetical protein